MRPLGDARPAADAPTVDEQGTLYDALSAMLTGDSTEVVVTRDGNPVGVVSRSAIFDVPNEEAQASV
jgi:osmoprotectant transport system ATP-binding protein